MTPEARAALVAIVKNRIVTGVVDGARYHDIALLRDLLADHARLIEEREQAHEMSAFLRRQVDTERIRADAAEQEP